MQIPSSLKESLVGYLDTDTTGTGLTNAELITEANSGSTSSESTTSIMPSGTYTGLAAAKFVKDNDKDKDGKLSTDEVSISTDAFNKFDEDGDGYLSSGEVKTAISGNDDVIYRYYKNGGVSTTSTELTSNLLGTV